MVAVREPSFMALPITRLVCISFSSMEEYEFFNDQLEKYDVV